MSFKYKIICTVHLACFILQVILCSLSLKPYACGRTGGLLGMLHYFSKINIVDWLDYWLHSLPDEQSGF